MTKGQINQQTNIIISCIIKTEVYVPNYTHHNYKFLTYQAMRHTDNFEFKRSAHIKKILDETGYLYSWDTQDSQTCSKLHVMIKATLQDQFKQSWSSSLKLSSKGINYSLFKDNPDQEYYIQNLPRKWVYVMLKFRTSNTFFPIEVGRWSNNYTEVSERICCFGCNDIGDEFHYLLVCKHFLNKRKRFIPAFYYKRPNIIKFQELLNTQNYTTLQNMCQFLNYIFQTFKRSRAVS